MPLVHLWSKMVWFVFKALLQNYQSRGLVRYLKFALKSQMRTADKCHLKSDEVLALGSIFLVLFELVGLGSYPG